MKGFYIEISNGLLDPKHCQQMGDSVWMFMWFLDKMTVIDHEKGEGKVLGGKPIKFNDVKDDLGISRSTHIRWIEKLRDGGYIETTRTPYGQSVLVKKAKKLFGRCVKNDTYKINKEMFQKCDISDPKMTHLRPKNDTSNKTVSVDNTVRQDTAPTSGAGGERSKFNHLGSEVIKAFEKSDI